MHQKIINPVVVKINAEPGNNFYPEYIEEQFMKGINHILKNNKGLAIDTVKVFIMVSKIFVDNNSIDGDSIELKDTIILKSSYDKVVNELETLKKSNVPNVDKKDELINQLMQKNLDLVNENDLLKNNNIVLNNKCETLDKQLRDFSAELDTLKNTPKLIKSSIFNENFEVHCINLKRDLEVVSPSSTIPLTKDNINMVTQLKLGVGPMKKEKLIQHLDNINSLDELPNLKIGIGNRTVEKLKLYFHISPSPLPKSSNNINEHFDGK
jgi:hypothetical protein